MTFLLWFELGCPSYLYQSSAPGSCVHTVIYHDKLEWSSDYRTVSVYILQCLAGIKSVVE